MSNRSYSSFYWKVQGLIWIPEDVAEGIQKKYLIHLISWKQNKNQGSPNHQHNKTWIGSPTNLFKTHLEWPGESAVAAALASPLHHLAKLCATTASSSDKTRLVSAPNTCMLHAFHLVTLTYASLIRTGTFAKLRPISCKVSSVKLSFKAKRQ